MKAILSAALCCIVLICCASVFAKENGVYKIRFTVTVPDGWMQEPAGTGVHVSNGTTDALIQLHTLPPNAVASFVREQAIKAGLEETTIRNTNDTYEISGKKNGKNASIMIQNMIQKRDGKLCLFICTIGDERDTVHAIAKTATLVRSKP